MRKLFILIAVPIPLFVGCSVTPDKAEEKHLLFKEELLAHKTQ